MKLVPQFPGQSSALSSALRAKTRLKEALASDRDRVNAASVLQGEQPHTRRKSRPAFLYTLVELKQFYIEHIASKAGSNP
jgi:hypothetical protein